MIYFPSQSDSDPSSQSLPSNATRHIQGLNHQQIFQLMDSILSFEACLYHQVSPLALVGDHFRLGMVNPDDTAALEYVGRILSYMNYTLVIQPMEEQAHKAVLSTYLNLTQASLPVTEKLHHQASISLLPDVTSSEKTAQVSQNDKPTFILLEPEDKASLKNKQPKTQNPKLAQRSIEPSTANKFTIATNAQAAQALPTLCVQATHQFSSVEELLTLPPKKLLQELLGRVLEKGIGRLYFERKSPQRGRIVFSQDGNLQCVLPDIPVQVFQAAIDELKQLTHLPLVPVKETLQAEIERFYQKERLLLRLRVIPGKYGEQATLQVLRGEALKFYQQQQIEHLSRDTLALANLLGQKLSQLRERAKLNISFDFERYESLTALNELVENLEQHLENLKIPT